MKPAFTKVNRYVFDPKAMSWSLPSGTTCPGAEQCLAKADRTTGKITNGPKQKFKCYSAQGERYPSVRSRYWANFDAVRGKTSNEVCDILSDCWPIKARRNRIHTAGDFFSEQYFQTRCAILGIHKIYSILGWQHGIGAEKHGAASVIRR